MKTNFLKMTGIIMLLLVVAVPAMAADENSKASASMVYKNESTSVFKGLLYQVWGRLRSLNPQLETNKTRQRSVATMGIRGAETTSSIIQPYWKGDKTDDKEYVAELTRYTKAQQYAEDGDLNKAVVELNAFLEEYQDSELKPNAQFALAISQGGLGDASGSKKTLEEFVDDNPGHPLVSDAKQVMSSLDSLGCTQTATLC
jgi:TolA-binding protein